MPPLWDSTGEGCWLQPCSQPCSGAQGNPWDAQHDSLQVAAERAARSDSRRYQPPRRGGLRHSSPEDVDDTAACVTAGDAKLDRFDAVRVADPVGHEVWEDQPGVIGKRQCLEG